MNILVFNCGSSSLSFKVFDAMTDYDLKVVASGKANNVATKTQAGSTISWKILDKSDKVALELNSHSQAASEVINILKENVVKIDAVGHRFAHGGPEFSKSVFIDDKVMEKLNQCAHYAPIHNPNSYSVIEVCKNLLPATSQYVVFDTSFHASIPDYAKRYAIPQALVDEFGFRKYGFHGLSYQYVSKKAADLMHKPLNDLNLIICHLGTGGSSVVAVKNGQSLDTSMGFTPLPGLIMSTRCGDIDAEIVLELVKSGRNADEVSKILNKQSGLIGLSEYSSNLIEIIEEGERGNKKAQLAFDSYAHRIKIYVGAYTWLLNRADAIIFTDDIGVNAWKLREKVCDEVDRLGVQLDQEKNSKASNNSETLISTDKSETQVWVIPTDEELVIGREVANLL